MKPRIDSLKESIKKFIEQKDTWNKEEENQQIEILKNDVLTLREELRNEVFADESNQLDWDRCKDLLSVLGACAIILTLKKKNYEKLLKKVLIDLEHYQYK